MNSCFADFQEPYVRQVVAAFVFALGLPLSIVEHHSFREMTKALISGGIGKSLTSSWSMSKDDLTRNHLNPMYSKMKRELIGKFRVAASLSSFELALDGFSTRVDPRHNAIVSCESYQYVADIADSHGLRGQTRIPPSTRPFLELRMNRADWLATTCLYNKHQLSDVLTTQGIHQGQELAPFTIILGHGILT